jgi:hypothetical protein
MLFLASFLLAGAALLPLAQRWSQALLGGFDVGVLVFSLSLWPLTRDHTPAKCAAMPATMMRAALACW